MVRTYLEFHEPDFEWDENKADLNFSKHDISFEDAANIFYGPLIIRQSDRNNEERWLAIGLSEDQILAVAFTRRGDVIRIISARRARQNEERDYRNQKMGGPAQGED